MLVARIRAVDCLTHGDPIRITNRGTRITNRGTWITNRTTNQLVLEITMSLVYKCLGHTRYILDSLSQLRFTWRLKCSVVGKYVSRDAHKLMSVAELTWTFYLTSLDLQITEDTDRQAKRILSNFQRQPMKRNDNGWRSCLTMFKLSTEIRRQRLPLSHR